MKILLCAATEMEIAPVLSSLSKSKKSPVEVLISGVGLMAATFAIAKAVLLQRPTLVIQAGVAGCFDESFTLGSVVLVKSETVGDSGVREEGSFCTLVDLKLQGSEAYPWTGARLENNNSLLQTFGLPTVQAVTVNEISTSTERIAYYRNQLSAQVESLEGAALHYVALQENVAFLQLRSLSNFVGERDKTRWRMQAAIENLNRQLQRLLQTVTA